MWPNPQEKSMKLKKLLMEVFFFCAAQVLNTLVKNPLDQLCNN